MSFMAMEVDVVRTAGEAPRRKPTEEDVPAGLLTRAAAKEHK
jgi:hypothetical protein